MDRLLALEAVGVRVAIDDVRVGHLVLDVIKQTGSSTMKLDGALVREIDSDRSARTDIAGIIDEAHRAGVTVVAEGVETCRQFEVLGAIGCDQAQGFLFGKGLPADTFEQWLADHAQLDTYA